MKMLRLYMLRDAHGHAVIATNTNNPGEPGEPLYFNDKMLARAARRPGDTVTYGPDHWKTKREDKR